MKEVVIVSGVRTAIGNYGGALQDVPVVKLGAIVIKEALKRAGLRPSQDPEVLSFAPEALKDQGLIELGEGTAYGAGRLLRGDDVWPVPEHPGRSLRRC